MGVITVPGWVDGRDVSFDIMVGKPRTATKSVFGLWEVVNVVIPTGIPVVDIVAGRLPAAAPGATFPYRADTVVSVGVPRMGPVVEPAFGSLGVDLGAAPLSVSQRADPLAAATGS